MDYSDNALNILTVKSFKGIGNAWIVKNLRGGEDIDSIVALLNRKRVDDFISVEQFKRLRVNYEELVNKLGSDCDGIIAWGDSNFPSPRGAVGKDSERAVFLYYRGDIGLLNTQNVNVTIIGLLTPTEEIIEREKKLTAHFVAAGATIISGLAYGCDSIAHQQTLECKGKTIAILPSTLRNILPQGNRELADRIVNGGGLLLSEYGRDFKTTNELNSRYVDRDRLQAQFCDTIVLAASYAQDSAERWGLGEQKLDSGARLAMGYAEQYGVPRAVMYDEDCDKSDPMFDLNRDLMKDPKVVPIASSNMEEQTNKVLHMRPMKKQSRLF